MNITCVLKELEKSVQLSNEENEKKSQQDSNLDLQVSTPNEQSTFKNFGSHAISTFSTNGIASKIIFMLYIFSVYFGINF